MGDVSRRLRGRRSRAIIGALGLLMLVFSACGPALTTKPGAPMLPAGWTWYVDSRFPFQVPVPPKWQTVAFNESVVQGQDCDHVVFLVPPGSPSDIQHLSPAPRVPEFISVRAMVGCPEWTPDDNHNYQPLSDTLTVSGKPAAFYGYDIQGYGIHRLAVTHLGGHQYLIAFTYEHQPVISSPSHEQHDLAWYMQVLQGFTYTG